MLTETLKRLNNISVKKKKVPYDDTNIALSSFFDQKDCSAVDAYYSTLFHFMKVVTGPALIHG